MGHTLRRTNIYTGSPWLLTKIEKSRKHEWAYTHYLNSCSPFIRLAQHLPKHHGTLSRGNHASNSLIMPFFNLKWPNTRWKFKIVLTAVVLPHTSKYRHNTYGVPFFWTSQNFAATCFSLLFWFLTTCIRVAQSRKRFCQGKTLEVLMLADKAIQLQPKYETQQCQAVNKPHKKLSKRTL